MTPLGLEQRRQLAIVLLAVVAAGDQRDPAVAVGAERGLGRFRRRRDRVVDEGLAADLERLQPMGQGLEFLDAAHDPLEVGAGLQRHLRREDRVVEIVRALEL